MSGSIQFGEFTLEMSERRLTRAGRPVALEPKTYDLLVILARHAGRLLTKRELLDLVWPESFVEEGILAVHVSNLRRVLGDGSRRRRYIETISRSGYRFIGRVTAADVTRSPQSTRNTREPSIAVLPFENMSGEKENEYFSDGLAEEISNALARIPELKVIARTSAFAFKGKHEDVRLIAEALGVSTVLEGSVRRAGSRVRVTAQLIAGADGSHLWSERYEREMTDVFAIQDEIAQAIAGALHVQLSPRPGPVRHSPKLPAYDALLKGRHHMLGVTAESLARAKECFEYAMALDPDYSDPHANLGLSYFLASMIGARSLKETMPLLRTEGKEALRLDPFESGPHLLLGAVAAAYDYDWTRAAEHFSVSTSGRSVPAEAHWAYASLYFQPFGRFSEAVFQMERAVEHDPLNGFWRGILASHLTHAGLYDRAIAEANEALKFDATSFVAHFSLGEAYATLGRWPEAIAALERAYENSPENAMTIGLLAGSLVRAGETTRADELVREMGEAPRPIIGRVLYHWLCADLNRAADWYEHAIEQRDPFALVFANGPLGSGFRQSTRWPKLARMMNLA